MNPKTGRPIELPGARYYEMKDGVALHYPGQVGARGLQPAAFSPLTGLTYLPAIDAPARTTYLRASAAGTGISPQGSQATRLDLSSPDILAAAHAQLIAWDPVQRKARWSIQEQLPFFTGTLATAGNLVFVGKGSLLRAFDAKSGKVLWSNTIPGGTMATPVTVQIDGEQLVLFAIGNNGASAETTSSGPPYVNDGKIRNAPSRLLAFKVGGHATLPPTNLDDVYPRPPLPRFPAELAAKGRQAMSENGCDFCHGGETLDAVGSVPNLKKSSAATHAAFARIVIGGERKPLGMPDFSYMDEATVKAIQAYAINLAWDAYEAQGAKHHE